MSRFVRASFPAVPYNNLPPPLLSKGSILLTLASKFCNQVFPRRGNLRISPPSLFRFSLVFASFLPRFHLSARSPVLVCLAQHFNHPRLPRWILPSSLVLWCQAVNVTSRPFNLSVDVFESLLPPSHHPLLHAHQTHPFLDRCVDRAPLPSAPGFFIPFLLLI